MKRVWKRGAGILMAVVLSLGMAACGGKKQGAGKEDEATQIAKVQMSKEGVYRYQELKLAANEEDISVLAGKTTAAGVEILTNKAQWTDPELVLSVVKADGTIQSAIDLEFYAPQLEEVVDQNGNPLEMQYVSTYCREAALTENRVYAIYEASQEFEMDGEYDSHSYYFALCWDKGGSLLWTKELGQIQSEESYSYLNGAVALADGSLGILICGDENSLIVVKEDGSSQQTKSMNAARETLDKGPNVVARQDGSLIFVYYNDDWSRQYAVSYDPLKDQLGTPSELPEFMREHGGSNWGFGSKGEILYATSEGVYRYEFGSSEVTKKMDFINSDLDTTYMDKIYGLDEEHFFAVYEDWNDYSYHACIFTYVKPEDVPERKTLVYGCIGVDYSDKSDIIKFNRSNSEYRITVRDYAENGDYESAYDRLNNDILAGNVPDILRLSNSMPIDSYIAKGVFVDIDELINKDSELSSMEYADNVFEAYRKGGKLYQVIPYFTVRTWIGKKSLLGDRTGITMAEANQAAAKLVGSKTLFGGGQTRDSFMYTIMQYCGSDFVDLDAGKCNFDTQLFVDLLEHAKKLPAYEEGSGYDEDYWEEFWETYYTQFRDNRTLLLQCFIMEPGDLKSAMQGMIGEEAAFCGFPTEKGNGSFIELQLSYAISAKSANVEGAWQYLRKYLGKEYQRSLIDGDGYKPGIPVWKQLIKEQTDALTERPYWLDENGKKEYFDDTFGLGDEVITLDPLTQAEADRIYNFICSVHKPEYYDVTVMNIVTEEAGAFFAGSKSAKEVAGTIQNRVQLYVNENR